MQTAGGRVVKTVGDGVICQFDEPDAAFRAGSQACASPSLMISVLVTPRRSSTMTTSPRATRRLFT